MASLPPYRTPHPADHLSHGFTPFVPYCGCRRFCPLFREPTAIKGLDPPSDSVLRLDLIRSVTMGLAIRYAISLVRSDGNRFNQSRTTESDSGSRPSKPGVSQNIVLHPSPTGTKSAFSVSTIQLHFRRSPQTESNVCHEE